jgi:hypothetical protein
MKRAVYAISAAAIAFIAAGTMLNATPIAPIAAVTNSASTNSGQVMRVYYYHRFARRHARRCYRSGGAWYYC